LRVEWFNAGVSSQSPLFEVRAVSRLGIGPVDLVLAAGECVAVTGKSGAGKSVLLRMLADLDPHAGTALLDGQACEAMAAPQWRRRVTYVAAESGWWDKTVGAHFAPGTDFATLLPAVGIAADAAGWPVERLSTGERQRLALLRALRADTRVLLLDEPTSGLDGESVAQVEALLRARLAAGLSIVLVTHDPAQAARMAARHLVLAGGRLAEAA
jgi:ABC-type multidrug transport system ATPase subunit